MRKGHNSLAMIVTKLFLFVSKNKKTFKGVYFDGIGLVLLHVLIILPVLLLRLMKMSLILFSMVGISHLSRTGKKIKLKK